MKLKNLMFGALLLCVAGCGCNDDSFPPGTGPAVLRAVLGVATDAPGVPVNPVQRKIPIDVFFLMDDARDMNKKFLRVNPNNLVDQRLHAFAAQRIMDHLKNNIEAAVGLRIDAGPALPFMAPGAGAALAAPGAGAGTITKDDLDFAFGVGRYEDFGGPFARRPGDDQTRPFILNMPLLRYDKDGFDAHFSKALTREAPGIGSPLVNGTETEGEPNTGIEALYQIATGAGFDGNGGGSTNDGGGPASDMAQDNPGPSGDVPQVQFAQLPAPANLDEDGEPIYVVQNSAGVTTMIDDPANPGTQIPVPASGNTGGVGWRPEAAKFIIIATNTATVAPLALQVAPDTDERSADPYNPTGVNIVSMPMGAADDDSPRIGDSIDVAGFNGSNNDDTQPEGAIPVPSQPWRARFGPAEPTKAGRAAVPGPNTSASFAGVAPLGAATVQQTIDELNRKDIEIVCLSALFGLGASTKPTPGGSPAVNGDADATVREVTEFRRYAVPWTWLTAISRLTGCVTAGPDRLQSFDVDNPNGGIPLVYNMGDVWPFDPGNPSVPDEALIKPSVVDDLADRIYYAWLQPRHLRSTTSVAGTASLVRVFYDFQLELNPIGNVVVVRADGGPNTITVDDVLLPTFDGASPPAVLPTTSVSFPQGSSIEWREVDDTIPVPAVQSMAFKITALFDRIEPPVGMSATDPAYLEAKAQVEAYLKARGDGTYSPDPMNPGELIPNPISDLATETVCHADGTLQLIVRDQMHPGPSVLLSSIANGCIKVEDLSPVGLPGVQEGGTCPFPVPVPGSSPVDLFSCPVNMEIAATSPLGALLSYAEPAAGVGQTVTCVPPSGSMFALGVPSQTGMLTAVVCELRDDVTNALIDSCTFDVTVVDRQGPAFTCPSSVSTILDTTSGTFVSWTSEGTDGLRATDQVDGDLTASITVTVLRGDNGMTDVIPAVGTGPFSWTYEFPEGTSTVTATVTDAAGNVGSCTFKVNVFSL
jgi:hypothetical protein